MTVSELLPYGFLVAAAELFLQAAAFCAVMALGIVVLGIARMRTLVPNAGMPGRCLGAWAASSGRG